MIGDPYSLEELAREWSMAHPDDEINVRTLRYYISEGLLAGPGRVGPGRHYSEEHLVRLELIRLMQKNGIKIDEIYTDLKFLEPDQLLEAIQIQETRLDAKSRSVVPFAREDNPLVAAWRRWKGPSDDNTTDGSQLWRRLPISDGVELLVQEELLIRYQREIIEWIESGHSIFHKGA